MVKHYITPFVNLIDLCGLSDPLIARIPAINLDFWRIGHHVRKMPTNYGEFKLGNVIYLDSDEITELAKDTKLLSTGNLFSIERLKSNLAGQFRQIF